MDSVFFVSPIVGSFIGYWTNWLAIKMLFRPLTKKEIFGVEIPFTPGVIPRRRGELAESIGSMVGKTLLTPDAFEKILQGPDMKNKVTGFIKDKVQNLEDEERSLTEILRQVFVDAAQVEKIKQLIKKVLNKNIILSLKNDDLAELIKDKLASKEKQEKLKEYLNSKRYNSVKSKIIEFLQQESTKEILEEQIQVYLKNSLDDLDEEQKIKDLLPESIIESLRNWVKEQKPEVIEQLISFLNSAGLKEQIEQKVDEFFNNNPMLSMLSGFKDKIVDKFLNYLISYVEKEENQEQIMQEIDKIIDSLLATPTSSLKDQLSEENLANISERIVKEIVGENNINSNLAKLEELFIAKLNSEEGQEKLEFVADKILSSVLVEDLVKEVVDFKVEEFFKKPLTTYFKNSDNKLMDQLEEGIVKIIEYIMEHHLGAIFATLDFENLVKDKINSFDVLEVERLILDVIETELNAITWFGAVLGFLLGLITPILSLL